MNNLNVEFVTKFVALQRKLISAYIAINPDAKDFKWLLDFKKKGSVVVDGENWDFAKHGVGLRFVRRSCEPHMIVDVHNHLNEPRIVDAWRLLQFSESNGETVDAKQLSLLLDEMCFAGYLTKTAAGQYLSCRELNGPSSQ